MKIRKITSLNALLSFAVMILTSIVLYIVLNMKQVVRELKKQNIKASDALTLKQIAADNNTPPIDLYAHIKGIVQNG